MQLQIQAAQLQVENVHITTEKCLWQADICMGGTINKAIFQLAPCYKIEG